AVHGLLAQVWLYGGRTKCFHVERGVALPDAGPCDAATRRVDELLKSAALYSPCRSIRGGNMNDRTFTFDDQRRFAELSGDRNPLHLDEAWASTVFPGAVLVHGIHALLWGLEAIWS